MSVEVSQQMMKNLIQAFNAICVGTLIWRASLMPTVFYTCGDFDGDVMQSFLLDVLLRIPACLLQVALVVRFSYYEEPNKTAGMLFAVLAAVHVCCVVFSALLWHSLEQDCPSPPSGDNPASHWKTQLELLFKDSYSRELGCRSTPGPSCYSTLDEGNGYQLLYNPKEWCKLALANSCPNLASGSSMERCLRYGARNFLTVTAYAFETDMAGDVAGIVTCVLCWKYFMRKSSRTVVPAKQTITSSKIKGKVEKTEEESLIPRTDTTKVGSDIRLRGWRTQKQTDLLF